MPRLKARFPDFGAAYDWLKMRELVRHLENLFSQIIVDSRVYGAFSDGNDQTVAANTAAAMTFDTIDYEYGVDVIDSSKLTVSVPGVYDLQFSAQLANVGTAEVEASVWLSKNGTDVPNTCTMITIPSKHGSDDGHAVAAWNFFIPLVSGDYVELMWCVNSTDGYIEYRAAQASPTRPAVPSIIATMSLVS